MFYNNSSDSVDSITDLITNWLLSFVSKLRFHHTTLFSQAFPYQEPKHCKYVLAENIVLTGSHGISFFFDWGDPFLDAGLLPSHDVCWRRSRVFDFKTEYEWNPMKRNECRWSCFHRLKIIWHLCFADATISWRHSLIDQSLNYCSSLYGLR